MHATTLLAHLAADADTFIFFVLGPLIALVMVRLGSGGGLKGKRGDEPPEEPTDEAARPASVDELPAPRSDRPPGGAV